MSCKSYVETLYTQTYFAKSSINKNANKTRHVYTHHGPVIDHITICVSQEKTQKYAHHVSILVSHFILVLMVIKGQVTLL